MESEHASDGLKKTMKVMPTTLKEKMKMSKATKRGKVVMKMYVLLIVRECVIINELQIAFRGRCKLHIYVPNKP